jgi:hypothetical protein
MGSCTTARICGTRTVFAGKIMLLINPNISIFRMPTGLNEKGKRGLGRNRRFLPI